MYTYLQTLWKGTPWVLGNELISEPENLISTPNFVDN